MRMILQDRDGSLISNRRISAEWADYYLEDQHFMEISIKTECKENGVDLISSSIVDGDILVLVKYPKEKM